MDELEEFQRLEEEREFAMLEQERNAAAAADEGGFLKNFDIYTGAAPTRRAIGRMQEGEFGEAVTGFLDPFSGPGAIQAPSGKDIVKKAGVPDVSIKTPGISPEMAGINPDMFPEGPSEGSEYNLQDVAGFGAEMALDPSNLVPPKWIAKGGQLMAKGAKPVTSRMGKAGEKMLSKASELRLIKAGMPVKDYMKFFDKSFMPKKTAKQMAQWLRSEPGITPFSSFETIALKSGERIEEAGGEIGRIYSDVTQGLQNKLAAEAPKGQIGLGEFFNTADMPGRTLSPKELKIMEARFNPSLQKEEVLSDISKQLEGFDGKDAALRKIDRYLDQMAKEAGDSLDPLEVHKRIKKINQQMIKWNQIGMKSNPAKNEAFMALRKHLIDNVDGQINVLDDLVDGKTLSRLKELNKEYSTAQNIHSFSFNKAVREKYKRINYMKQYGEMGLAGLPFLAGGATLDDIPAAASIYLGLKSYQAAKNPTKILVNELVGNGLLAADDVEDFLKYAQPEYMIPTKALLRGPLRNDIQGPQGSQIMGPEEEQ